MKSSQKIIVLIAVALITGSSWMYLSDKRFNNDGRSFEQCVQEKKDYCEALPEAPADYVTGQRGKLVEYLSYRNKGPCQDILEDAEYQFPSCSLFTREKIPIAKILYFNLTALVVAAALIWITHSPKKNSQQG